jgi:CheY-like chemotaxis protein
MSEPTIMLVDDDDDIREIVTLILQGEGYRIIGACDGAEALELLTQGERPPLIFLDMMMPVLNGVEFLRKVKADPNLADIPIVVMSGDTAARNTAYSLGAAGCLAKPVELDTLLEFAHRFAPASS